MTDTVAVILAAGKSTRMKSALPKVLHEIFGRPMIEYVLDAARGAGAIRLIVVIGHEGERVQNTLQGHADVEFAWQRDPQGTGHAVMMCAEQLRDHSGRTLVLAGDTPLLRGASLQALLAEQESHGAACVIGSAVTENNFGLGRIVRDPDGAFLRIVEQKDASPAEQEITEVNTGCYVFDTQSLLAALGRIDKSNSQGELYLTDCPAVMLREGQPVLATACLSIEEAMGVNTRQQLADIRRVLHDESLQQLMLSGVSVPAPHLVDVDPRAAIGVETVIHPFTVIQGAAQIGERCEIGPHAVVGESAVLADGDRVPPFTSR